MADNTTGENGSEVKVTKLLIYTEKDYEGSENIKAEELKLIKMAAIKADGDRERMARMLGITTRTLYNKIIQHSLQNKI